VGKIRVALLGGYVPDSAYIRGGVQAASLYLINGLLRIDDLELHLLGMQSKTLTNPDYLEKDGVRIHLLPVFPKFERLRNYRNYQSSINCVLSEVQPMVLHAQEAGADALVAIRTGYPTVVTVHGFRGEDAKYVNSWQQKLRFYFDSILIERAVMHKVKYLIAISRYVTTFYSSLFRSDIRVNYIPNAVDHSFFNLRQDTTKMIILCVGRVTPLKRIVDLINAFVKVFQQNPEAQLRIAGETTSDPAYVNRVQNLIQELGLVEHIHLLGHLCQEDLLKEYRECCLVVLPSGQENAPIVLAQAMAAGKPVVATSVGGVPEMVGENGERGLLVKVGDIDGLAAAISQLLIEPSRRELMGKNGRIFALDNYHQDKVAQRTFEFYQLITELEANSIG